MKFTVSKVDASPVYRKVLRVVSADTESIIINTAADPDANIIMLEFCNAPVSWERVQVP